MATSRLEFALDTGAFVVPEEGRIAVFGPPGDMDLSVLPRDRCHIIQTFKPDHDLWALRGYDCATAAEGDYALALVCLARARAETEHRIAQASDAVSSDALASDAVASDAMPVGQIVIDGQKTDGIDTVLRALRPRTETGAPVSKAHGKLFVIAPGGVSDWHGSARDIDGFTTFPGVFSADGIDPGSAALAAVLPAKLGRRVADMGAGWGYLSAQVLLREGVEALHLIEADHTALACARRNIIDPRAQFHWADATAPLPDLLVDTVVMNPPFHVGRKADPSLGRAFIVAAARLLTGSGHLWMVANRHLPYETTLAECFTTVTEVAGDPRFKLLHATRPLRKARGSGQR